MGLSACAKMRLMPLLLLLIFASHISAQTRAAQIDAIFAPFAKPSTPGCALGVIRNHAFVFRRAYGLADLERNVPLTTSSPIYLASVSKQFTAAAIARLEADGKLSLDDPARRYVPELPAYAAGITIRHLIHHTSGLRDYLSLMALAGRPVNFYTSNQEFLELMGRQKALNFPPGSEHLYSNSGYVLLTIILRRVTGQTIRSYAQEMLFGPLGMRLAQFADDRDRLIVNRALGYSPRGESYRTDAEILNTVGDGGMFASVDDFLAWNKFLDSTAGERLLEKGLLSDGRSIPYAFGLVHGEFHGHKEISHGGGFRGYRTYFVRYPADRLSVVCLCNNAAADPGFLAKQVAALYLDVPAPGRAIRPRGLMPEDSLPSELSSYTGTYYSSELDSTIQIEVRNGRLRYRNRWESDILRPSGTGGFTYSGVKLTFDADSKGFTMDAGRVRGLHFERRAASATDR